MIVLSVLTLIPTSAAVAHAQPPTTTPAPSSQPPSPSGDLAGTAWKAIELAGLAITSAGSTAPPRNEPYLEFGTNGRVSGADGCNRLMGSFTQNGRSLSFGTIAGTQMACAGTEEIAKRFRGALQGTSHWSLVNGRLEFYGATGKPLAVFEKRVLLPAPAPPRRTP